MGIKHSVNEDFFHEWTPIMAYVLGFIYADGSLEDGSESMRGKYLRITNTEKEVISNIRSWLGSQHKIQILQPWEGRGVERYLLRIGSHKIFDQLSKLGLHPNKSLTVRFPEVPNDFLFDFIRGYFDGDGCVNLYKVKNKQGIVRPRKLTTIFTSGSRRFLEGLEEVINSHIDLKGSRIYDSNRAYQLRYSTNPSVDLFKYLYDKAPKGTYFVRKFNIFEEYFRLRPEKVTPKIQSTLKFLVAR